MGLKGRIKKGIKKTGKAAGAAAKSTGKGARSAGKATRNAAVKTGRVTKKAAGKAGKAAASVGEGTLSVAQEVANRAVGLPEAALNAAGVLPPKKLRLRVVVLAAADGNSVVSPSGTHSTEDRVKQAVDIAKDIFWTHARVKIVSAGGRMIRVDRTPAPSAALTVRCDTGALRDDLGGAGFFFRKRMARNAVGTAVGTGAPITAFVVEDVVSKHGCSLGPLTDYVTVDVDGITKGSKRTLAHELGHALGLPHTGGAGKAISGNSANNLMRASNGGEKLNKRQVTTIRNSRHITFL